MDKYQSASGKIYERDKSGWSADGKRLNAVFVSEEGFLVMRELLKEHRMSIREFLGEEDPLTDKGRLFYIDGLKVRTTPILERV